MQKQVLVHILYVIITLHYMCTLKCFFLSVYVFNTICTDTEIYFDNIKFWDS